VSFGRRRDKISPLGDVRFVGEGNSVSGLPACVVASVIAVSEPPPACNAHQILNPEQADNLLREVAMEVEMIIDLSNRVLSSEEGRHRLARHQHDYRDDLDRVVCVEKPNRPV
jgi:hypothetical protein